MKYFISLLIVAAFIIVFSIGRIAVQADDGISSSPIKMADGGLNGNSPITLYNFVCPSCQKFAYIKQVERMHLLGFKTWDWILYCSSCGYNTERDAMGNIKFRIANLWEWKYSVNAGKCSCSLSPVVLPSSPLLNVK